MLRVQFREIIVPVNIRKNLFGEFRAVIGDDAYQCRLVIPKADLAGNVYMERPVRG